MSLVGLHRGSNSQVYRQIITPLSRLKRSICSYIMLYFCTSLSSTVFRWCPCCSCLKKKIIVLLCVLCYLFVCVEWCPTHIVLCFCFVFLHLVYPVLPVSLHCHFLIVPLVFSNVYLLL